MKRLETDVLPEYLMERRWYRAKNAGIPNVRIADFILLGGNDAILLLDVTPAGRSAARYLLAATILWDEAEASASAVFAELRHASAHGVLVEAFSDDRFIRQLIARIVKGDGSRYPHMSGLIFRRSGLLDGTPHGVTEMFDIERSAGEQSNTSIRIGGMMLKVFRKLEPGIHPELEVGRFLTEKAGFRNTPALLGSVEHAGSPGVPVTALCVLQTLVPSRGDGWTYVVDRLQSIAHRHHDAAAGKRDVVALARRLGQRTAELHRALAVPTDDKAFRPEPVASDTLKDLAASVRLSGRSVFEALRQCRPQLDPTSRDIADRLLARSQDLLRRIDQLVPTGLGAKRTRLHGDYHLGQVLVSDTDVFIIDFEGEPMRPLPERRAKHLPLRDVAGMLRSFDYAAAAVTRGIAADGSTASGLQSCAARMSSAFLESYCRAIRGCPSFPADLQAANKLLRLFVIEKALYEITYELANRPSWACIPLASLLAILEGLGAPEFKQEWQNDD